jgi:hypothetical protein
MTNTLAYFFGVLITTRKKSFLYYFDLAAKRTCDLFILVFHLLSLGSKLSYSGST